MINFQIIIGLFFHKCSSFKEMLISSYLSSIYKRRIKQLGVKVRFNGISTITGADKIKIGNNVHIGNNAYIRAEGGLVIGDNTHISRNLVLYTHNHNYEGKVLPYDNTFLFKEVTIEKNVWIGMNVIILPGSYIEEGAIVGAGAVVAGRVQKGAIVASPKASLLSRRNMEHYKQLEENNRYGGVNGHPIF